jgi:hypothetical protein
MAVDDEVLLEVEVAGKMALTSGVAVGSGSLLASTEEDVEAEAPADMDGNRSAWRWLAMAKQSGGWQSGA